MEIFGRLEEFGSELYPYRYIVGALALAALVAVLYLAYRRGWHLAAWRHRLVTAAIGVPVIVIAAPLSYYLLSPLWERSHLEEASPLAVVASSGPELATADGAPPPTPTTASKADNAASFQPGVVLRGKFEGADSFHFGRGEVLLIEVGRGRHVLRFENFSVRNGPDLFVYLSRDSEGLEEGALNLGKLKATDGAFNYEIPEGTDISQFRSAIVWCKQFSVLFASATLAEM